MFRHLFPKVGDPSMLERPTPIGFIFEPKLEGTRIFIYKDHQNITIVNQKGIDITFKFPELLDLSIYIKQEQCVLDGVLTVLKNDEPDYRLLQTREIIENPATIRTKSKKTPATVFVFDILEVDGCQLLTDWLKQRRQLLEKSIRESTIIKVMPSTFNGKSAWQQVKEKNYEGLIAKTLGSKYEHGENWSWLKMKNLNFADIILAGLTEEDFLLACYDQRKLRYIGKTKRRKDDKILSGYLNKKIKQLKTKESLTKIPKSIWIKPEIIARIQYDSFQNELKNPKFLRICFDKIPEQCKIENAI